MATQEEQIEKSKKAISHVLRRIRDDAATRYQLGFGTQSFEMLTEAAAALFDEPLEKVRGAFGAPCELSSEGATAPRTGPGA